MNVAIIGATGAVGKELLNVLYNTKFPLSNLYLFASERSASVVVSTPFGDLSTEPYSFEAVVAKNIRFAFVAVSGDFSLSEIPKLAREKIICIDNSSAFRYDSDIRLVVPGVNSHVLSRKSFLASEVGWRESIIANPNCTTAIVALILAPIAKVFGGLDTVVAASYQAASGAGERGMKQLALEMESPINFQSKEAMIDSPFRYPLKCNLIPAIDVFTDNGYTKEEMKLVWETRKILEDSEMKISATCVRVPTMRAHAVAVSVKTKFPCPVNQVRDLLKKTQETGGNLEVLDDIENHVYPTPLSASNKFPVQVGRIRQSLIFGDHGIDFFVVGDQLLRGAALNAVEIARAMIDCE